ncbi:MAG: hypothetical protein LBB53_06110, partial [Prevotellaceae bacterium]|nr:hypothetical protein [Prevotellaceae bacterium]
MKKFKILSAIVMVAVIGFISCTKKPVPTPPEELPPLVATWVSANEDSVQIHSENTYVDAFLKTPDVKAAIQSYFQLPETFTFNKDSTGTYVMDGESGNFTYSNTEDTITIVARDFKIGQYYLGETPIVVSYLLSGNDTKLSFDYDATIAVKYVVEELFSSLDV